MPNPFDVFDQGVATSSGNPFDAFDKGQNPFDAFDGVLVNDRPRPESQIQMGEFPGLNPQAAVNPLPGSNPWFGLTPEERQAETERGFVTGAMPIPQVHTGPDAGLLKQIGAGGLNVGTGVINALQSPAGIMTAGAGSIGALPRALLAGLWGAGGVKGGSQQLGEASVTGNMQTATEGVLNTTLGTLAGVHGAREIAGPPPLIPEVLPPKPDGPLPPLNRTLAPRMGDWIDADATGQKLLGEGQKQIGYPSMAEALARVDQARLAEIANDAASQGQGKAIASGEGQSSGSKSKAPISEDGNSAKSGSMKDQDIPIEDRGSAGGNLSSLGFLDPAFWKQQLGIAHQAKVDAVQLYNRVRNKLGEKSASWEMLNTPEFQMFMKGTRTPEEVEKWVEENGPRVEVRKFGERNLDKTIDEIHSIQHQLDTVYPNWRQLNEEGIKSLGPRAVELHGKLLEAQERYNLEGQGQIENEGAHWSSIAPKPESQMPGYVEIAVVKPTKGHEAINAETAKAYRASVQFPSSHSFPPNTLGFVRGYMEGDTFHVVEVQSDWAQANREWMSKAKAQAEKEGVSLELILQRPGYKDHARHSSSDPLLGHYERLALKAAIEHARSVGAKKIAVQDAASRREEGENYKPQISQEPGMRLHYDRTLQKIAEELTGSKGEKVSFGEHKMAFEETNASDYARSGGQDKLPRKDLIFRNPDGTPKTDVSAYVYPLEKVKEHLTYAGKDAPPRPEPAKAQTPMLRAGQQVKPGMVTGKVPEKMSQLMKAYDLPENATYAEVAKVHRERAKALHPDRGGSPKAMAHENAMFDAIEDKMVKQIVRGQREMEEGLVGPVEKAIAELKDAIDLKRQNKPSEKYGPADAHVLERWQLALQNAVAPFKPKTGMRVEPGRQGEAGALNLAVIKDAVNMAAGPVKSVGAAVRWYSEPLVERLGRLGGPASKWVSEKGGQIISRQKKYYGELTPVLDPAKRALGKPTAANTWMRRLHKYNDRAAANNMFAQNEGTIPANPSAARETALLGRANLAIGHLATRANSQFVPSNKLQRMLTSYGVDVVRRGAGPAWEAWTKGVADANGKPLTGPGSVQEFFREWKAEMDKPQSDVGTLNKISQDFVRQFPKSVTHIKPGMVWHEVLVADPFAYLEGAAQRTASAVAFREVYPDNAAVLAARKAVQAEVPTDMHGTEFDNLIRALQGHPTDTFVTTLTAPDTWTGGGTRMLSQVVGSPLKSLMLSGNFATNIGEVLVGGPAIFLGYKNALPAVLRLPYGYRQLEMNGQVNRALQNYSYDPSSPVRSAARGVSGVIRKVSFQQELNELQEAHAAMAATVVADRIRAHDFSATEGENFVAAMRAMGMTEAQARRALAGDNELLGQFERRASAALTSGHMNMAERSRAGSSRAFNELFWFHSYPQMASNQLRKVIENLAEDVKNGNGPQAKANGKLLARLIAGRTMQGAITAGIYALIFGGLFGLAVKKKEAKDELGKFLIDSFIGGLGGPAAIGKRLMEQGGDSKTLAANVVGISTPVSAASEIYDIGMGNGRYEGRRTFEKIGMFIESHTPALKMLKTGMAAYGLSEGDPKLDAAKKAFYRWRRDEKGWKSSTSEGDSDEDKDFRAQMRRVVETLNRGGDWRKELEAVGDKDRAGKSLFARTLLRDQNGKGLSEADKDSLRKRIGDDAVKLLEAHDSMIRQIARELGEKEGNVKSLSEKPLGLAVDSLSEGKRLERLDSRLPSDVRQWLSANELHLNDVSPKQGIGRRQHLVSNEAYDRIEEAAVQEYERRIRRLMMKPGFQLHTRKEKQEKLNEELTLAEERAKRLSR